MIPLPQTQTRDTSLDDCHDFSSIFHHDTALYYSGFEAPGPVWQCHPVSLLGLEMLHSIQGEQTWFSPWRFMPGATLPISLGHNGEKFNPEQFSPNMHHDNTQEPH